MQLERASSGRFFEVSVKIFFEDVETQKPKTRREKFLVETDTVGKAEDVVVKHLQSGANYDYSFDILDVKPSKVIEIL